MPATPSSVQQGSDSEYTESPEKSKNKRVRSTVKKASPKSSSKRSRKQIFESDSDSADENLETPTKRAFTKPIRRTAMKKSGTAAAVIQPGVLHKTPSTPIAKAEPVEQFDQVQVHEEGENSEDEGEGGIHEPEYTQHGFTSHAQILMNMSGSSAQSLSAREESSGLESFLSTPASSNDFADEAVDGFVQKGFLGAHSLNDNGFGGLLSGCDLDSFYRAQFDASNIAVSSSPISNLAHGQAMAIPMCHYPDIES